MQFTSSPRRALGLVAVGAIGMSTAVLGVTGTASAATNAWTFTTASSGATKTGVESVTIETDGECTIAWVLDGASGGAGLDGAGDPVAGAPGGRYTVTTEAYDGDVYDFFTGGVGGDATSSTVGTGGLDGSSRGDDGYDGGSDGTTYGGGGGGATIVERDGDPIVGAFGGEGGIPVNGGSVGGLDGEHLDYSDGNGAAGTPANIGGGVISGTVTCVTVDPVAPGAPTLADWVQVGDGTATFQFTPGTEGQDSDEQYVRSSWEYRLDGGAWTAFTEGYTGSDDLTGSITGLTNLKTYSLTVRATSTAGNSPASAPVSFTPYAELAAPASVSATTGVSSVRISWTPAADATGAVSYEAFIAPWGAQSSAGVVVCTAPSGATTCVVPATPGSEYGFGVRAIDAAGNPGASAFGEKPTTVPASAVSATLPKSDGALTSSASNGKAVAGEEVTISGTGFLPGSTVELVVYSTPVKLGEAVVLADGTFSATVTLPKGLANGTHHLVATGVDADGNVRNLVVEVTVSGGAAQLAYTGFSAAPVLGAGALALLAGGGLLVAARRRTAA